MGRLGWCASAQVQRKTLHRRSLSTSTLTVNERTSKDVSGTLHPGRPVSSQKAAEAGGGGDAFHLGPGCPAPGGRGQCGGGAAATAAEVAERLRRKPLGG